MKTQPKLENIPVVIVSADFPYHQEECLQEGATDFVKKPVHMKYLKELEKYLKKQSEED